MESLERDLQRLEIMKTLLEQTENICGCLYSTLEETIKETERVVNEYLENRKIKESEIENYGK